MLMSFGCSSAPVTTPPPSRPPDLEVTMETWTIHGEEVTLPYSDLRAILANRKRWVAYGKAREVGNGE